MQREQVGGFVGNDEHVAGHPHEGVLEKRSLVMQAFEEDENGRVGKPTGQTDQAGQLKKRKKDYQGLQNGGNNDGINGFMWVNCRQMDFGPAEPQNPVDEIKAHKGNKQRKRKLCAECECSNRIRTFGKCSPPGFSTMQKREEPISNSDPLWFLWGMGGYLQVRAVGGT